MFHQEQARENKLLYSHPGFYKKIEWVGGFYFSFFIPGPPSDEVNYSKTIQQTLTIMCKKKKTLL